MWSYVLGNLLRTVVPSWLCRKRVFQRSGKRVARLNNVKDNTTYIQIRRKEGKETRQERRGDTKEMDNPKTFMPQRTRRESPSPACWWLNHIANHPLSLVSYCRVTSLTLHIPGLFYRVPLLPHHNATHNSSLRPMNIWPLSQFTLNNRYTIHRKNMCPQVLLSLWTGPGLTQIIHSPISDLNSFLYCFKYDAGIMHMPYA